MIAELKNLILYGGLEKEEFKKIKPDIKRENLKNLRTYSIIGTLAYAILFPMSLESKSIMSLNTSIYLVSLIVCAFILMCTFLQGKNEKKVMPLTYAFIALIYIYALSLLFNHPEFPALTAVVMIVIVPLLYTDKPIIQLLITIVVSALSATISYNFKLPEIGMLDVKNAMLFGALSMVVGVFAARIRLNSLRQAVLIRELSEIDVLTGVRNRNSYEQSLSHYENLAHESICCVYADVNGLHELNNTSGHQAGDHMLKVVSEELIKTFGKNDTYRIGGDEFVAFAFDLNEQQLVERIDVINRNCFSYDYYVSIGYAGTRQKNFNLDELIHIAEKRMYESKKKFYELNPEKASRRNDRF